MLSTFKKILLLFIVWRVGLFFIAFIATLVIPGFGGRFPYADKLLIPTGLPEWIWGFGNFDGVHYIKIAEEGYKAEYSQAFFPLFPYLMGLLGNILSNFFNYQLAYFLSGLVLANLFFVVSLFFLYKLFNLDFDPKTSFKGLLLLLAFPTAFYFGSIYTESLFLFLTVLSLFFIRTKLFLYSGITILLASSTRIIGLMLIPALALEVYLLFRKGYFKEKSSKLINAIIGIVIAPLGTLLYMLYLRINFENPIYFLTSQPAFGAERSAAEIILLPQVVIRYIKILTTIPTNTLTFWNATTELFITFLVLSLLLIYWKKIRLSYLLFSFLSIVLPTLTGTFSSMPRYVLNGFLVVPQLAKSLGRFFSVVLILMLVFQAIFLSLFIRGYWVA